MISFEEKYSILREFVEVTFDGEIQIQELIFGFNMEEPVNEKVITGVEELIVEMDLEHIPDVIDPLMDRIIINEKYHFLYDLLTRHSVVEIDLPKPI